MPTNSSIAGSPGQRASFAYGIFVRKDHSLTAVTTTANLLSSAISMLQSADRDCRSAAVMALSRTNVAALGELFSLLGPLNDASFITIPAKAAAKERKRRDELRTDLMRMYRIISRRLRWVAALKRRPVGRVDRVDSLSCRDSWQRRGCFSPKDLLENDNLSTHLLQFIERNLQHSRKTTDSLIWELETVRVDFCFFIRYVVEAAYHEKGFSLVPTDLRKSLWKQLCVWCGHGKEGQQIRLTEDRQLQELFELSANDAAQVRLKRRPAGRVGRGRSSLQCRDS